MIQKKFLCKDLTTVKDMVAQISDILSQTKHKDALITFYENGFSRIEIDYVISVIKKCNLPNLQLAGISLPVIAELMPEGKGILFNLILTDEADIEVVTIPCLPGGECEAAGKLKDRLSAYKHPGAVELFCSNLELNTPLFMERSMEGHEDTVLFGTATLRSITQKLSVEKSENTIEIEQIDPEMEGDEFVVGDKVLYDGFVAIIFAGEKLRVRANYALGWKPIGRKLSFELGEKPVRGGSMIKSINSMPAVDVYKEYLGVYPDAFFISNICEFPLVVERNGLNICMVPTDHGENGELSFMMTLKPQEKLRFTFASHDEVLYASRESLESMEAFCPDALFLTLCGNRINYLKEDAHIEWDTFADIAPDHALMHGAGEMYYYKGRGGILNSAHLAIGLRETDGTPEKAVFEHETVESLRHGRPLPLSDRMSAFLGKITSELVDMATQAQDANKAKSAFLSHMSHEIRTPINAILGMDEMILRESSEEDILDYADNIRSACNNLLGIVNDILDLSKIEAGKMSIVPAQYELISVVKDMYNVVKLRAEEKGLSVKLDIDEDLPSGLFGDSTRIKQVITNILTNAVKYTETGSVTLIMKKISDGTQNDTDELKKACPGAQLPKRSVRIRVTVKDTGIGIKPEDMEKLFDEYERFDEKRNRNIEGTGLGLNITRELLELMGSRLTVESIYGKGSEFGFEIVQGVEDDEPVGSIEGKLKKTVATRKRVEFTAVDAKILVVDDTLLNLVVVQELLKKTKIKIDTASSGEEAISLVQQNSYDLIFLDHKMPGMDGIETLKKMKELGNNHSAGAPVIALTSNTTPNAKEEYINDGFKDYLSKPFKPEELEDMLFYYISPEKVRTVPIDLGC
ncbi:MAG: response regulator [Lachnospiraceae bacterium]|nr:response regulator [Lachnospiraceae bacterium]